MNHSPTVADAIVFAGIPAVNNALYHRLRFSVGDPAALVYFPKTGQRLLILRDIEMTRARERACVDEVACPADYAPTSGLSGDRETATAQALAECLVRANARRVTADRTMPLIFADEIRLRGLELTCDRDLGVTERRQKDEQEIAWLQEAQATTEGAMEMACQLIGRAEARSDGALAHQGHPLTPDRVRAAIDVWLLERGYSGQTWIVAGGPEGADCHDHGHTVLRTEQPVIVDIFPQNRATRYHGDCTRTVVHGDVPDAVRKMHAAVVAAKQAACEACRAGMTGAEVHAATARVITDHGYAMGLPTEDSPPDYCGMTHGTGHGIGLEVHEPPLLDKGGPELLVGDVVTIEPGLYEKSLGGLRVEDMVVVAADGCRNLNRLPEGLSWT